MRIFKTKLFCKWAKKNLVNDALLKVAAEEISNGFYEANLGGYFLKKRVATKGRGKIGSVRTIVAYTNNSHCFFVFGFEKNKQSNISTNEEKVFKIVARELLNFSSLDLSRRLIERTLFEVDYEK